MKNYRMFTGFRALALAVAALMGACVVDSEKSEEVEQEAIVEEVAAPQSVETEPQSLCCDWGWYSCPSTGESYDYDTPQCGPFTKPKAKTMCEAACPVACVDGGWQGC